MASGRLASAATAATFRLEADRDPFVGRETFTSVERREALAGENGGAFAAPQCSRKCCASTLRAPPSAQPDRRCADDLSRETRDDRDLRIGLRVGLVDDPERRLAARHERERRADVLGLGKLARDLVP